MFVLVAVALALISNVVELVKDNTVVLAEMPVPLMGAPTTKTLVSSMVTVASPLVVSTVLSVKLPLPVSLVFP